MVRSPNLYHKMVGRYSKFCGKIRPRAAKNVFRTCTTKRSGDTPNFAEKLDPERAKMFSEPVPQNGRKILQILRKNWTQSGQKCFSTPILTMDSNSRTWKMSYPRQLNSIKLSTKSPYCKGHFSPYWEISKFSQNCPTVKKFVTSRKTDFPNFCKIFCQFSRCHKFG